MSGNPYAYPPEHRRYDPGDPHGRKLDGDFRKRLDRALDRRARARTSRMLCSCREELHAARRVVITRNGLSHVAAKATEAAAAEAAEASTTAARRTADRPTHAYEPTREA